MTDKELVEKMAEEYAEYNQGKYTNEFGNLYHAHLAGLKAGSQLDIVWHDYDAGEDCYEDSHEGWWVKRKIEKPKWHDLRKDPNDLPENSPYFRDKSVRVTGVIPLSEDKYISLECRYYYSEKKWRTQENYQIVKVIAWIEIPKYIEEKPNTAQEIINKQVTLDIKPDGFGKIESALI